MKGMVKHGFIYGLLVGLFVAVVFMGGAVFERIWGVPILNQFSPSENKNESVSQKILTEESVVTEVAERVSGSVVTVTFERETPIMRQYFLDPFGMFRGSRPSGEAETEQVDIGSGFIVDKLGLVVTNKHVVSQGNPSDYVVVLKDESEHQVEKIWRDPVNDLAILKISNGEFNAIEMGDSDKLKVGNFVVAIGTALGEFRHNGSDIGTRQRDYGRRWI